MFQILVLRKNFFDKTFDFIFFIATLCITLHGINNDRHNLKVVIKF